MRSLSLRLYRLGFLLLGQLRSERPLAIAFGPVSLHQLVHAVRQRGQVRLVSSEQYALDVCHGLPQNLIELEITGVLLHPEVVHQREDHGQQFAHEVDGREFGGAGWLEIGCRVYGRCRGAARAPVGVIDAIDWLMLLSSWPAALQLQLFPARLLAARALRRAAGHEFELLRRAQLAPAFRSQRKSKCKPSRPRGLEKFIWLNMSENKLMHVGERV